ncbi:MAG: hypothetical protein NT041_01325 [Candidatus Vogelbacteria bacterium]|nr:hypothetical protein [Candidatus Vogelbacteria bacterium]
MKFQNKEAQKIHKLISSKTSSFWVKERNNRALALFHKAAEKVPAYKKFLARHKIDPEKIKTWTDFQKVPTVNKKNFTYAITLITNSSGTVTRLRNQITPRRLVQPASHFTSRVKQS